jgi:regulator of sirC expression with transglutaminase-like and TPR domain
MKESEKLALIKLIEDPNNQVYTIVEQKILEIGFPILHLINEYYIDSDNSIVKRRNSEISRKIVKQIFSANLESLNKDQEIDLYELTYSICLIDNILLNRNHYYNFLNDLLASIRSEWNESLGILSKIHIINHIIYQYKSFLLISKDFKTENYFLSNLLENSKGSVEVFSLLYIVLGQQLGLKLEPVYLPISLLIAVVDQTNDVLYYINPGYRGAIVTEKEITNFLKKQNIKSSKSFYEPINTKQFLIKLFSSLEILYRREANTEKAELIYELRQLLIAP